MTREEIEQLIEAKLAPVHSLVDRIDTLMAHVHAMLSSNQKATSAAALHSRLAEQSDEFARLLTELHQMTAKANERLGGKTS